MSRPPGAIRIHYTPSQSVADAAAPRTDSTGRWSRGTGRRQRWGLRSLRAGIGACVVALAVIGATTPATTAAQTASAAAPPPLMMASAQTSAAAGNIHMLPSIPSPIDVLVKIGAKVVGSGAGAVGNVTGTVGNVVGVGEAPLICPFKSENPPLPESYFSGQFSLAPMPAPPGFSDVERFSEKSRDLQKSVYTDQFGNRNVTAYERYGMAGLNWSLYYPGSPDGPKELEGMMPSPTGAHACYQAMEKATNGFANWVFNFAKVITGTGISMYQWVSAPGMLEAFEEPLDCIVKGCDASGRTGGNGGLDDALFLNFLQPIILFGALWMGWVGLVKKRTTEAAQGALWMIGAATMALVFMANPALIASKTNDAVASINATTMETITSGTGQINAAKAPGGVSTMCSLPDGGSKAATRVSACSIYKGLIFAPWAAGQFGVPLNYPLPGADGDQSRRIEVAEGTKTITLPSTVVSWSGAGGYRSSDLRVAHLDAQARDHDQALTQRGVREDGEMWYAVGINLVHTEPTVFTQWSGIDPTPRVTIALAAVFASGAAMILLLLIAFSSLVLAMAMFMLLMLSPLFLVIGAHPGFGRGIGLKWLELLIGTAVKRVFLGVFLAVLVGFYQIILETQMSYMVQVALILAIGIGAIMYRKPLLETLNVVNLGGSRSGLEQANGGMVGRRAAAGAAGGVAGGLQGMAGGGAAGMGGFVAGMLMGSRSGSLLRGAQTGGAAGRQKAAAEQQRRRQEERAREKEEKKRKKEAAQAAANAENGDGSGEAEFDVPPPASGNGGTPRPDGPDQPGGHDDGPAPGGPGGPSSGGPSAGSGGGPGAGAAAAPRPHDGPEVRPHGTPVSGEGASADRQPQLVPAGAVPQPTTSTTGQVADAVRETGRRVESETQALATQQRRATEAAVGAEGAAREVQRLQQRANDTQATVRAPEKSLRDVRRPGASADASGAPMPRPRG